MLLENFFTLALIACIVSGVWYYFSNKKYKETTYYKTTKIPLYYIFFNTGIRGEYYTYQNLQQFEADGAKLLFNAYIPKQNGGTTEIDVMLISTKGIFVIESKNYSGWIYGSEHQEKWCQTIKPKNGKVQKNFFYNPIKQNSGHIHHLKFIVGDDLPIYSIIVFSNRCILKKIEISNRNAHVIHRANLFDTIDTYYTSTESQISPKRVYELYDMLFPYTQTDIETRQKHIAEIKKL